MNLVERGTVTVSCLKTKHNIAPPALELGQFDLEFNALGNATVPLIHVVINFYGKSCTIQLCYVLFLNYFIISFKITWSKYCLFRAHHFQQGEQAM